MRTTLAIGVLLAGTVTPAIAQTDYRNPDDGRPSVVEDAYPVERFAGELMLPYAVQREDGQTLHLVSPGIEYGIAMNAEAGISAIGAYAAGGDASLAGVRVSALYNFNTDLPSIPAIAVRTEVQLPVGGFGGHDVRALFKAIATRNWGATRVHLNAGVGVGGQAGGLVPLPEWLAGAAIERTFVRPSLLVVADVHAEQSPFAEPAAVNVAVGARWQWTPLMVLDAGVTRRLGRSGPDGAFTVGVTRTFAIRSLIGGK